MQVSNSYHSNLYQTLGDTNRDTPKAGSTDNKLATEQTSDRVTLSPEATKELEKLAAYSGKASTYLPGATNLNNPNLFKPGYASQLANFENQHRAELNEYQGKFKDYYNQTKLDFGIHTNEQHYQRVTHARDNNPDFQRAFEDKLRGDPRMLELMGKLGVKQPE